MAPPKFVPRQIAVLSASRNTEGGMRAATIASS
jgi:hypothetical protein